MNILVTGGTGFIGQALIRDLLTKQHTITLITRHVHKAKSFFNQNHLSKLTFIQLEQLTRVDEFDAIINLAGEPIIGKRWSNKQKNQICQSRWHITLALTQLIKQSQTPPSVFISASAIGFYGVHGDELLDETRDITTNLNDDFGHYICKKWEQLALEAQSDNTRVCILRIGIVLGKNGGALSKMLLPFKLGLGGHIADGKQGMSWVHLQDLIGLIDFVMTNTDCSGIYNGTAPNPVSNNVFSKTLANSLNRPCLFPVPEFVLKLVMGESAILLTKGQFVTPKRALNQGFYFKYSQLDEALKEIVNAQQAQND